MQAESTVGKEVLARTDADRVRLPVDEEKSKDVVLSEKKAPVPERRATQKDGKRSIGFSGTKEKRVRAGEEQHPGDGEANTHVNHGAQGRRVSFAEESSLEAVLCFADNADEIEKHREYFVSIGKKINEYFTDPYFVGEECDWRVPPSLFLPDTLSPATTSEEQRSQEERERKTLHEEYLTPERIPSSAALLPGSFSNKKSLPATVPLYGPHTLFPS
ncbi:MAG: uncharacterized protein A8A55_2121 [Amphiamblys sp. WSBS2006]|nr:MAG: uncharacterized protein A8A55_2121 [Amphiamblys sp. WSBS2006]